MTKLWLSGQTARCPPMYSTVTAVSCGILVRRTVAMDAVTVFPQLVGSKQITGLLVFGIFQRERYEAIKFTVCF